MINLELLKEFANTANQKIDRVILNGTHIITDFAVKQVTGTVLAINYLVKASDVPIITKIELAGHDGVVSSHNVSIPIQVDQVLIQEIEVLEG